MPKDEKINQETTTQTWKEEASQDEILEDPNSFWFRFRFVKMLKGKLESVTKDEKTTDPDEIKSIVYLIKKYGYDPPPPEMFQKDQFLDRFYLKNSLGPYRYKGKLGRCFALWKKRNDPKLKPFKHLILVAAAMVIGLVLVVFDHITYAGNFKSVYQVQRYAESTIRIWKQNKNDFYDQEDDQMEQDYSICLDKIPEKYRNKIYLPIEFLSNTEYYQCYDILNLGRKELQISYFDNNAQWINMFILINKNSLDLNYILGDDDTLQEDKCIWNNSHVYRNKITQVKTVIFEIESNCYIFMSNMETKELIEIINKMEVYK